MSISKWPRVFPLSGKQDSNDSLWLKLTVKELESQDMAVRELGGLNIGDEIAKMMFLLPITYQETINHDWEDIDTIASKVGEKFRSFSTAGQQLSGLAKGNLEATVDSAIRPDSPTIFKSSQKRDLNLSFHLADQGDTERDVFEPVNLLMYYSSSGMIDDPNATTLDDYFKIKYPYIFQLQTITGENNEIPLIKFNYAALTSVQPSYSGPYRNGYPTKCELTLTFKDLEPLFKRTFSSGPTILTVSTE